MLFIAWIESPWVFTYTAIMLLGDGSVIVFFLWVLNFKWCRVKPFKWTLLIHQLVKNDSNTPPIWQASIGLLFYYFRCPCCLSAATSTIGLVALELASQTKITEFDIAVSINKSISHLDISMYNISLMEVAYALNKLHSPEENHLLWQNVI